MHFLKEILDSNRFISSLLKLLSYR